MNKVSRNPLEYILFGFWAKWGDARWKQAGRGREIQEGLADDTSLPSLPSP
jgi:hypothetical protein